MNSPPETGFPYLPETRIIIPEPANFVNKVLRYVNETETTFIPVKLFSFPEMCYIDIRRWNPKGDRIK